MSVMKYGLTSYEDYEFNSKGNQPKRGRDEFIRLQNGSNEVRLITDPYVYMVHKFKEEGDKGFGDKVMCSKNSGSCPLCEHPDKMVSTVRPRWFVGLIDRSTQTYKVLDMSSTVFQQLQQLSRKERWGDPTDYDIDITVDKTQPAAGYYTVIPLGKEPLSESDVEIKKKVDLEALAKRCTPPTAEAVLDKITRIRERKNGVNTPRPSMVDSQPTSTDLQESQNKFDFTKVNM